VLEHDVLWSGFNLSFSFSGQVSIDAMKEAKVTKRRWGDKKHDFLKDPVVRGLGLGLGLLFKSILGVRIGIGLGAAWLSLFSSVFYNWYGGEVLIMEPWIQVRDALQRAKSRADEIDRGSHHLNNES